MVNNNIGFTGRKHTKKSKLKMSLARKGKKKKDTSNYKGPNMSKETIERIAIHNKKLWKNPEYRKKRIESIKQSHTTPEFRKIMSLAIKGVPSKLKGRTYKDIFKSKEKAIIRAEITRKWMIENNIIHIANKNGTLKNTKIEQIFQQVLDDNNIISIKQYKIKLTKGLRYLDFYLPEYNIGVEVDGCYWHGCMQCYPNSRIDEWNKTVQRTHDIMSETYIPIYHVFEHDISKNKINMFLECLLKKHEVIKI